VLRLVEWNSHRGENELKRTPRSAGERGRTANKKPYLRDLNGRSSAMNQITQVPPKDDSEQVPHLIASIARSLVDNPQEVSVELSREQERTLLRLRVDPNDIGQIIGKRGRTARSLRAILSAVGWKLEQRFVLEIAGEKRAAPQSRHERI
jgi:predicted RNA-binding protein YlqC (UPF0109 family)